MLRLNRNGILSIILLASLAGSGYFFLSPQQAPASDSSSLVEESMTGVYATRYDKEGRLNQIVSIESWQHIKNDTVTSMIHPTLKMHYPNGNVCEISANQGEAFQTNLKSPLEKLHLMENVVVHQLGQAPDAWWELKTTNLLYFPGSETALTDDPVTVLGPSMLIQAHGIRAYLNDHRVEFINQVTSRYAQSS